METRILIASDSSKDAEMCGALLQDEFKHILLSTNPDTAAADFDAAKPNIVILAFEALEAAERYYLGLYRLCPAVHTQQHVTIVLCSKDNVREVYDLCRKGHFNDYVLFWPLTYDFPRLSMAVHHAARTLEAPEDTRALREAIAAQVKHLTRLEAVIEREISAQSAHTAGLGESIKESASNIRHELGGLEQRIIEGGLSGAVEVKDAAVVRDEFGKFRDSVVAASFAAIESRTNPIETWLSEFRQNLEPELAATRSLRDVPAARLVVLVVDDDEFQHKAVRAALSDAPLELAFAATAIEAFAQIRNRHPAVVLLDYEMPDLTGIEVLKRLRATPEFAAVPVIMLTGNHDEQLVRTCLKAGANDFIIKPYQRAVLVRKLTDVLRASVLGAT